MAGGTDRWNFLNKGSDPMPFIKLKLENGVIKLLNADSIREAEYDEKEETLSVFIGNNGGTEYFLHGKEAREAFDKLKSL
jgi:hypothetical protein